MFYVYIHYRADNLTPFYIGKGQNNRLNTFSNRSNYWKRVKAKYGCIPKIIAQFENESDAFSFEKYLIKKFKNENIELANFTEGGGGVTGWKHSSKTKETISQKLIGNNFNPGFSGEMNPSFKSLILATNLTTQETIILNGPKSMKFYGFNHGHVYGCVNNKRPRHKGYTFKRLEKENYGISN
jgi:hypothetical protein